MRVIVWRRKKMSDIPTIRTMKDIDSEIKREAGKRDQHLELGTPASMLLALDHQDRIDSLLEEKKALGQFGEYVTEYKMNLHGDDRWLIHFPNGYMASIIPFNGYPPDYFTVLQGWLDKFEVGLMVGDDIVEDDHPLIPGGIAKMCTRETVIELLDKIKELPSMSGWRSR